MRISSSLCVFSLWFSNFGDACSIRDRGNAHATTLQAYGDTMWRRVSAKGDVGAVSSAEKISDIFNVGDWSTPGGCNAQMDTLNEWLKEAITLQDAIVKAYNMNQPDKGLRKAWEFTFGIKFTESGVDMGDDPTRKLWNQIGRRIDGVTQFLNKAASFKPWILCSEEAGSLQQWDQPIQDEHGNYIPSELGPDGKPKNYYTLRQVFQSQHSTPNTRAFYMEAFRGYDFYTNPYDSLCGDPNRYAVTSHYLDRVTGNPFVNRINIIPAARNVIFCQPSFSPQDQHSCPSLSVAVLSPYYPPYIVDSKEGPLPIEQYLPISGTFYHELYHLTDMDGTTGDQYRYMLDVYEAASKQHADNADNPESYLYMAMTSYMYLNPPQGREGVLFPAGVPKNASDVV